MALEGIRAVMEIHFRAIVVGNKQICWFTTWDLSQIVQNFEIILAAVFNKTSNNDVMCSEKVHDELFVDEYTINFFLHRYTVSCVIPLVQFLQHHFMVSLYFLLFKIEVALPCYYLY